MGQGTNQHWLSVTKAKDIAQLLLACLTIIAILAATDIFLISKESKLEYNVISSTLIKREVLEEVITQQGLEPEAVLPIGMTKIIGGEEYFLSPIQISSEYMLEPVSSLEELRTVLLPPSLEKETELFQSLPEDVVEYIKEKLPGETVFPNPYLYQIAFSGSLEPTQLTEVVRTVKEKGEEYSVEIRIQNVGSGESGPVRVALPEGTVPHDESGRWSIAESAASIEAVKPGEEVSLVLKGENEIEFQDSNVELSNKESMFRKVWLFWFLVTVAVITTSAVAVLDWNRAKLSTGSQIEEKPGSES